LILNKKYSGKIKFGEFQPAAWLISTSFSEISTLSLRRGEIPIATNIFRVALKQPLGNMDPSPQRTRFGISESLQKREFGMLEKVPP
jgi:hypothetical protein